MKTKKEKIAYVYIGILSIIGILLYRVLLLNFTIPSFRMLIYWTMVATMAESLWININTGSPIGVSVSSSVYVASIVVGGPLFGATVSILGMLFRIIRVQERKYSHVFNLSLDKTIYNVAQVTIMTSIMGLSFIRAGGIVGELSPIPVFLMIGVGMVLNIIMLSILMSLIVDKQTSKVWIINIKNILSIYLATSTLGIILSIGFISYGYWAVLLFIVPLFLAYYSFKSIYETRKLYISTIEAFNSSMEAKDSYTYGHSSRVEKYSVQLAEYYNLPFKQIQDIKEAAILHDIGKIGVSDIILNKVDKLTEAEYNEIKRHSNIGAEILQKVSILEKIALIVKHHHERFDGNGYPDGLSGDNIPLESSILAIADAYDAMTTDRPYRDAFSRERALEEIKVNIGIQFHPILAQEFIHMMNEQSKIN